MAEHDVQMPEQIEELARGELSRHLTSLDGLQARIEAVDAIDGGLLYRENAQTAYDPIESQVAHLASAALEPLDTCSRLLQGDGLPLLSLYPLIRASIEASAYAFWLLCPGTSAKRVLRSLRMTLKQRDDADAATASISPVDAERKERFLARLHELKAMNRNLQQSRLDVAFPSTTDVLIEARQYVNTDPYDILTVWRICSGLSHSNKAMTQRILERRRTTEYVNGVAQFHMTSSFTVIEGLMRPAIQALHAVVGRLEERAAEF